MRGSFLGIVVGAVASMSVGSIAVAQNAEEITIVGTRTVEKDVRKTPTGVAIREISLTYAISVADLDLRSYDAAMELGKRVQDASMAACKEIGRRYPLDKLTPDDAACAKTAADKAMITVHERIAAAGNKSAK